MTVDLYASSHSRLRRLMQAADAAVHAVEIAAVDREGEYAAVRAVGEMLDAMRRRSEAESCILHPLIGRSLPEVRAALDRQHALIAPLIDGVANVLDAFASAPSPENARVLSVRVRRFVDAVRPHMEEEEALVPLLTSTLSADELDEAARALGGS